MIGKPTLIVHTTYFPEDLVDARSTDPERGPALRLGEDLYGLLTRPKADPLAWGPGIGVRVATRSSLIDCKEAKHVVVVPVLGPRAHACSREPAMNAMADWRARGAKVLPVFEAAKWRSQESDPRMPKAILTKVFGKGDSQRRTLNEILLALARVLSGSDSYAFQLFISHAKVDLAPTGNAAKEIADRVTSTTTGKAFFDEVSILPGEELTAQIDRGSGQGVFIAVRGDMYSSRAWCRKELLHAKQRRLPTLIVEVLTEGEARSAAYAGNGPTVVWGRASKDAPDRVITLAMAEAVRHLFFLEDATRIIRATGLPDTTERLSRPPELLDVAALRGRADAVIALLHPDPPLPPFERAVIQEADKRLRPVTPTTAFAGAMANSFHTPLSGWQVALSLSDATDAPEGGGPYGLTADHLRDATVFLARALIGVGAEIAYGGDFRNRGFTELLSQIVVSYSETGRSLGAGLHAYLAAPIDLDDGEHLTFTSHSLRAGGRAVLDPPEKKMSAGRSALHFSDMRRYMEGEIRARVVMGGATVPSAFHAAGYGGRYPGVVEEAWRALETGHPLYVAGGFGGAAKLVAACLRGKARPRLTDARWAGRSAWRALVAEIDGDADFARLGLPKSQDALASRIQAFGEKHLASDDASCSWNGLTVAENRKLFRTRDPLTVAALVLKGLLAHSTVLSKGKLRIELVQGDVSTATDLDLLVFPTFRDLPLDGAGAALDRASGGAATRAHRARKTLPSGSSSLGAECVYAADLGEMNVALKSPVKAVADAANAVAEVVRRYGFRRVGVVTFLGNVVADHDDVVRAMTEGLRHAAETADFVWFERDAARADRAAAVLGGTSDVVLTRRTAPIPAIPAREERRRTLIAVRQEAGSLSTVVLFHEANGLASMVLKTFDETSRAALAGTPNQGAPTQSQIASRGAQIVQLLFGEAPDAALGAIANSEIVIMHDGFASGIPYEAMTWEVNGRKLTPATQGGIVRHLLLEGIAPERALTRPAPARRLGVLVVIDPLMNLDGARAEGEALVRKLRQEGFEPRVLDGREATVERVRTAIADPEIDVLHYCGHAFFNHAGPDGSGLNLAGGSLTLADLRGDSPIGRAPSVPRLVFVNGCEAARVRAEGLDVRLPQAFAEFFLAAGVDAYLGPFWRVSDAGAATFAAEVYTKLTAGVELGDAVVAGRRVLQAQENKDWANYALYGHAAFRLVQPEGAVLDLRTAGAPSVRLDDRIIVATWTFSAALAPRAFAVIAVDAASGELVELERPMQVTRRDGWSNATATVTWGVTATLRVAPLGVIQLRPSDGVSVDVSVKLTPPLAARSLSASENERSMSATDRTRPAPLGETPHSKRLDQIRKLRTLLDQQPDGGRGVLHALHGAADPDVLLAAIDTEEKQPEARALWPLSALVKADVDAAALEAFTVACKLSVTPEEAGEQKFQTKEDWAAYVFAPGAVAFTCGSKVEPPLWRKLKDPAAEMTHDVRDGEFVNGTINLDLFSDNANGLHASRAIAQQVVESKAPYAFHLGDVYYGGSQKEFAEFFERPLAEMLSKKEFFMIAGNHEMFARGQYFQEFLQRKATDYPDRQRQRGEMFRLRGPGFRIIGIDTMFVGADSGRFRLHDFADRDVLDVLEKWLKEDTDDLTILMTTNEAWDKGNKHLTPLYESLRTTIAGKVDMWYWGNVHYGALYEPWAFADTGAPRRKVISSCIGHGGYPFYTQTSVGTLPDGVGCRWLEKKSRFWPDARIRPDVGANGWCRLALTRGAERWDVKLIFVDWAGRARLRASMVREDGQSIRFGEVEESNAASVVGELMWTSVRGA